MLTFRRIRFAKYVLVTLFVIFVYSLFMIIWIPRQKQDTNIVVMNPESGHRTTALTQHRVKVESSQNNFQANADIPKLKPASRDSLKINSRPSKVKPNLTDVQRNTSPERVTQRAIQRSTQRHQPVKPSSSTLHLTSISTTPFPLGEDNTWNFTAANNPQPFNFLKNASHVCSSHHVFILNVIHSKPSHFLQRSFIRGTWGNSTANPNLHTATVFFLGKTIDPTMENAVDAEYHKYHDIVQEDFLDSYRNLTYKAIAVLKWITNFCPNAEFVLKTDDDVFVNPFDINRLVRRQLLKEPNATKIMCQLADRSVLRQKQFKWYVPETEYPYKRYPPYCRGTAFIIPQSVITLLYNASFTTKFFWIDDVYSTGMLAHVANVSHTNIVKKFVYEQTEYRDKLLFGDAAIAHVGGGDKIKEKKQYWEELLKIEANQT